MLVAMIGKESVKIDLKGAVIELFEEINRQGTTILMVTHSERVAAVSERIIYLVDGNIQGVLNLGKLENMQDLSTRERKLKNWLDEMNW